VNYGNQPPQGYPPQQPYGPPSPYSPYAPPGLVGAAAASAYGDSAGEHLQMRRGRYGATVYVFFAFLLQIGLITAVFAGVASLACALGGFSDDASTMITLSVGGSGFVLGAALAYFVFRDRWKCIEAFSSRFCSGLMNLSLLYVPWVALVYANVRGIQKLSGK
jgi:hypothetical protein